MAALPECPRRGCSSTRVVLDGIQRRGGRPRQRFRCYRADGSYHRFIGKLGRTRQEESSLCVECENHIHAHEGPAAPGEFEYLVREVADALVRLGQGSSYTEAAKRARVLANVGKDHEPRGVRTGQTVAEWVADFVPVVAKRHAETAWPEVLVLDSTEFMWTNPRTGDTTQLFAVMAAYGYDANGENGRLWKLWASPTDDAAAWKEFLDLLPGKPRSVVCDRDFGIIGGVQAKWGKGKAGVPIHLCEYHLLNKGRAALMKDGIRYGDPLNDLLHDSLHSHVEWCNFEYAVQAQPELVNANKWVAHWSKRMRAQTARRASLPPVYGNGAIEAHIDRVRQALERRAWTFRNRERMNLLLELIRLRSLRADNATTYAADIRAHLLDPNRPSRRYRAVYDTWGTGTNQVRVYSLRPSAAQVATRKAKNAARKAAPPKPPGTTAVLAAPAAPPRQPRAAKRAATSSGATS